MDEKVSQPVSPREAMQLALAEARKGWGFVSPNPLVGCTIVDKDHRLLSVGYHARLGGDHAEIAALKKINPEQVEGAHIYVTLEPCAHQGRTGSCARALAPLKPASLTYAVEDPNPLVAGKGAQILREAGVKCINLSNPKDIAGIMDGATADVLVEQAEELAEIFLYNQRTGTPFVGLKVAMSDNGMIASKTGEPRWLTGEKSREHVHWLRAGYDAVLVGRGTFETDNPSLNVRHASFPNFENRAVVLDPTGATLSKMAKSNLIKARKPENVFVVVADNNPGVAADFSVHESGVTKVSLPLTGKGKFKIRDLLTALQSRGVASVMVEGGALTYAEFVNANAVQRIHAYVAPIQIPEGISWLAGLDETKLEGKIDASKIHREKFGVDTYWTARVRV